QATLSESRRQVFGARRFAKRRRRDRADAYVLFRDLCGVFGEEPTGALDTRIADQIAHDLFGGGWGGKAGHGKTVMSAEGQVARERTFNLSLATCHPAQL